MSALNFLELPVRAVDYAVGSLVVLVALWRAATDPDLIDGGKTLRISIADSTRSKGGIT